MTFGLYVVLCKDERQASREVPERCSNNEEPKLAVVGMI